MADQTENALGVDREKYRLCRQWVLFSQQSGYPANYPADWESFVFPTGETLAWHPLLRINLFSQDAGGIIGIGLLVNPTEETLGLYAEENLDHENIVRQLRKIGGTYVVIRYTASEVVLYTDPAAMLGVYYSDAAVASTPTLLPDLTRDRAVDAEYPLRGVDNWYTGSLTPFVGVRALMANHSLRISDRETERFWPVKDSFFSQPKDSAVAGCCRILQGMMSGVATLGRPVLSLTGGRDSRVNLAASKAITDAIEYFTLRSPNVKKCDLDIPKKLVAKFNLKHTFHDCDAAPQWLLNYYDEVASGMSIGARRDILGGAIKLASDNAIHINGNLGAITKSYFWHSPNPREVKVSALVKEFENKADCIVQGVEEWLRSVPPDTPPTTTYNLMYLEQRGGRWAGTGENASSIFYESFTPFNSRELFELLSSMPVSAISGGSLLVDFVRHLWPELLSVPYCRNYRKFGTYIPKSIKTLFK